VAVASSLFPLYEIEYEAKINMPETDRKYQSISYQKINNPLISEVNMPL
jgi:hypothetical protein